MKSLFLLSIPAFLIAACSSSDSNPIKEVGNQTRVSVIQPIEGLEIPIRMFQVSADAAATIELPNGGRIAFPENAFVDQNGKPISGTVTIEWQEYHSLADILVSGIPMKYDSAGVSNQFISGGMFTIDAHQQGKEVELAKGKEATVVLATYDEQQQFNFYSLNEQTGDWSYKTTALSTPNPALKTSTTAGTNGNEQQQTHGDPIFLNVVATTDSVHSLAGKDIIGWNISRDQISKKLEKTITQSRWDARILKQTATGFELQLSNKKQILKFDAQPVTIDEAIANTSKVEKQTVKKWENILAFQQQQKVAQMIRTASIPGFGTYNWDIIHMRQSPIAFRLKLDLPNGNDLSGAQIFHICPDEKSIVCYIQEDFSEFSFDPTKENCIIAIFPDKSVYTVSDNQFDAARENSGARDFTFDMKGRKDRFNSGRQLGRLVKELM